MFTALCHGEIVSSQAQSTSQQVSYYSRIDWNIPLFTIYNCIYDCTFTGAPGHQKMISISHGSPNVYLHPI